MSFIPVLQYVLGIGFFGFMYWLLDGILDIFIETDIHVAGAVYNLMLYLWVGILVVYLIFGGWWVIRKYNEQEYPGGMM